MMKPAAQKMFFSSLCIKHQKSRETKEKNRLEVEDKDERPLMGSCHIVRRIICLHFLSFYLSLFPTLNKLPPLRTKPPMLNTIVSSFLFSSSWLLLSCSTLPEAEHHSDNVCGLLRRLQMPFTSSGKHRGRWACELAAGDMCATRNSH